MKRTSILKSRTQTLYNWSIRFWRLKYTFEICFSELKTGPPNCWQYSCNSETWPKKSKKVSSQNVSLTPTSVEFPFPTKIDWLARLQSLCPGELQRASYELYRQFSVFRTDKNKTRSFMVSWTNLVLKNILFALQRTRSKNDGQFSWNTIHIVRKCRFAKIPTRHHNSFSEITIKLLSFIGLVESPCFCSIHTFVLTSC